MPKIRDFDAELKALGERAKLLKQRKVQQYGDLVEATGADALDPELLAGALLAAVATTDKGITADWSKRGAEFFRGRERKRSNRIRQILRAARRLAQKRNRIERARSRYDNREWVVARRARTKHLIELGGLVAKARLVELADDTARCCTAPSLISRS